MTNFKESKRQTFTPLLYWLFCKVDWMCVAATAESMDMKGFHKVNTSRAKGSKSAVQSRMNERIDHTVSCAITYKSATERRVQRDGARGTRTQHKTTLASINVDSNQNATASPDHCGTALAVPKADPDGIYKELTNTMLKKGIGIANPGAELSKHAQDKWLLAKESVSK
jgi:E3 ubiquitin-protein ligase DOA10